MKKIITLVLMIGIFLSFVPVGAEALLYGEDYTKRIDAYDFEFILKDSENAVSGELCANGSISASCKVKRTAAGTGAQGVTLVVSVYNGGQLIGCKTKKVTATDVGVEVPVALDNAITLPADVSKIRAYGYIWSDFIIPKVLARPATLNSSSNSLYELNINGESVNLEEAFANGDMFICELPKIPKNLPVVTAKADDLGADITIENITALPGIANVNVTSQTGVTRSYEIDFSVKANPRTISDVILADANSRPGEYKPDAQNMLTNIYNGVAMNKNFEGTLKRALIQLDVSKFPDDFSLVKSITLTVTGQCNYLANHITPYCPDGITIYAYDFPSLEWNETNVDLAAKHIGPGLSDIIAKTPFDSFYVEKPESTAGPWIEKSVDITQVIKNAKENGDANVTVILLADNTSRNTPELLALKNENPNNRDELKFVMATKENSYESRRPKIVIEEYEREE